MNNKEDLNRLLAECRTNNRTAQGLLYKSFYAYSMSVCLRYVGDREEARQVLNDGFVKVFKKLEQYREDISFKGWLRRILINTAIDHYRSNKLKIQEVDLEFAYDGVLDPEYHQVLDYEHLLVMVQKLPPAYQVVFNMYAIDGYSHDEISRILGIAEGTSKSNLSRARVKLQEMIHEFNEKEKAWLLKI
jgi:RNA polymerase sigma factor (sigma-70 family)